MPENDTRLYTARIKNGSALLADVKTLLSNWDICKDADTNLRNMREQNILGKASRYRLGEVLGVFRQRYFAHPEVGNLLVFLVQNDAPSQWVNPLLYFFAAESDRTLRDIVIDVLYRRKINGYIDLPVIVVQNSLREWVAEGKTSTPWNDVTLKRVGRGIMATLRDFGALEGKAHKHISPVYLPVTSFSLIAFWLMQNLQSGNRVLNSDEWKLFFLDVSSVERNFIEAHQEGLLSYHAAGSVVRLEFPSSTLQEYASVLFERTR